MPKVTVKAANLFTSLGKHFAGDVVELPQKEIDAINKINDGAFEAQKPAKKPAAKKASNAKSVK